MNNQCYKIMISIKNVLKVGNVETSSGWGRVNQSRNGEGDNVLGWRKRLLDGVNVKRPLNGENVKRPLDWENVKRPLDGESGLWMKQG